MLTFSGTTRGPTVLELRDSMTGHLPDTFPQATTHTCSGKIRPFQHLQCVVHVIPLREGDTVIQSEELE